MRPGRPMPIRAEGVTPWVRLVLPCSPKRAPRTDTLVEYDHDDVSAVLRPEE
jgi:hypothetical protein